MNKAQKEVQKYSLEQEKKTIRELKQVYSKAKEDCEKKIAELSARQDMENLQSIIYQKKYQEALKNQLDGVLNNLKKNQYPTVNSYIKGCYETGYVGNMYDLQKQGIPMIVPIDQKKVTQAIQTDSKISHGLYNRLGEDVSRLKDSIRMELSRGVANGSSWGEMATKIAKGMNSPFNKALGNATRIARTEGHRVQQSGTFDAMRTAKGRGANVVKQWDATLDGATRDTHRELDGQIVDVDEEFTVPSTGARAMFPSNFGDPSEDCNCRCCVLQRAKWGLDEDELQTLKDRADFFELDKSDSFDDFKNKYLNLPNNADTISATDILEKPITSDDENYNKVLSSLQEYKVAYNPVTACKTNMTEQEIINTIAGGDKTLGSCASVGLSYIGQKQGWDVLDFRDGESRKCFSRVGNLFALSKMEGITAQYYGDVVGKSSCALANNFLKTCEEGKEYYLCVGKHASIVRKQEGKLQYLELQSSKYNGWINFNGNPRYTLTKRFGCSSASGHGERYDFMMNITDSNFNTDEFKSLLGYINTAEGKQVKGIGGTIK